MQKSAQFLAIHTPGIFAILGGGKMSIQAPSLKSDFYISGLRIPAVNMLIPKLTQTTGG